MYMLIMATIEVTVFLTCFVAFFAAKYYSKKRMDLKTYFLLFFLVVAFVTHNCYLWYAWMGP